MKAPVSMLMRFGSTSGSPTGVCPCTTILPKSAVHREIRRGSRAGRPPSGAPMARRALRRRGRGNTGRRRHRLQRREEVDVLLGQRLTQSGGGFVVVAAEH